MMLDTAAGALIGQCVQEAELSQAVSDILKVTVSCQLRTDHAFPTHGQVNKYTHTCALDQMTCLITYKPN